MTALCVGETKGPLNKESMSVMMTKITVGLKDRQ